MLVLLAVTTVIVASVAAWGGFRGGTADAGAAVDGKAAGGSGILRIGTTSYIDSFNPWNYIEGQGLNAMIMVYPLLIQVDYSKQEGYYIVGDWAKSWKASAGGKTWTFKLRPNTKWSDGQPMTADDAAWTINTTIKYAGGATAVQATSVNHVEARDGAELDDARRPLQRSGRERALAHPGAADRAAAHLGAVREEAEGRQGAEDVPARRASSRW